MFRAGARSAAQSSSWSAGRPRAWVSMLGTGSPGGGGTPSGIGVPSCHEELDATSSTAAPGLREGDRSAYWGSTLFG
jgi:hypothetical protein